MIYFVVAQKESDGEWKLFRPWEYIDGADAKIETLIDDIAYGQVDLARVLTDEDNPDKMEWLAQDKHDK